MEVFHANRPPVDPDLIWTPDTEIEIVHDTRLHVGETEAQLEQIESTRETLAFCIAVLAGCARPPVIWKPSPMHQPHPEPHARPPNTSAGDLQRHHRCINRERFARPPPVLQLEVVNAQGAN